CWSGVPRRPSCSSQRFQSRKRFRHCWSAGEYNRLAQELRVSIAKAIPSLVERGAHGQLRRRKASVSIAKAIPSLLEPDNVEWAETIMYRFQSRKRFRHCWSKRSAKKSEPTLLVSIAKAI